MKKWLKILLPIGVVVLGVAGASVINATAPPAVEPEEEASPGPVVSVRQIQPQNHEFRITSWGELQPREKTSLTPEVTGRIVELHQDFIIGGLIKQGEVLVRLDDADYQSALLTAESNLAEAEARLQEERALAQVAERELRGTENPTALALRQPQLQSAQAAVKSSQAALQKAQRDLERTRIAAPYDALVKSRNSGVGQVVSMGTVLGEIYNVERAEVHLPIASFDTQFLLSDVIGSPAYINTANASYEVAIVRDLGTIDRQTRMTTLVASIDDPYALRSDKAALRFGQFVSVDIAGQQYSDLFRLPQEALVRNHIWLVKEDNTLERREVEVLRKEGADVWVRNGISANDSLVVMPPNFPQPGMTVRPVVEEQQMAGRE
ncbi:efflux RND transporter periplasmic adaptor subunit [Aliidiomarina sp. Khilg15.8]